MFVGGKQRTILLLYKNKDILGLFVNETIVVVFFHLCLIGKKSSHFKRWWWWWWEWINQLTFIILSREFFEIWPIFEFLEIFLCPILKKPGFSVRNRSCVLVCLIIIMYKLEILVFFPLNAVAVLVCFLIGCCFTFFFIFIMIHHFANDNKQVSFVCTFHMKNFASSFGVFYYLSASKWYFRIANIVWSNSFKTRASYFPILFVELWSILFNFHQQLFCWWWERFEP